MFSCQFWEISKNTFFYRTPQMAASWASHFRCYCFFSPAIALKDALNLAFHRENHPFEAWNFSAMCSCAKLIVLWGLFHWLVSCSFAFFETSLTALSSNSLSLSDSHVFPFCANLTRLKSTLILSLFSGSSHFDIETPYFLVTFNGFVPDYFSESDNLFLFKLAIFHNIQL